MSGVSIIGTLLHGSAPLIAIVPIAQIKAGQFPDTVALPAVLVRSVSRVDRQTLRQTGAVRSVERVGVTVRATSYRDVASILKLVREACAGFTGDIAGARGVSVRTAGGDADVSGPGGTFERTDDFRVTFEI